MKRHYKLIISLIQCIVLTAILVGLNIYAYHVEPDIIGIFILLDIGFIYYSRLIIIQALANDDLKHDAKSRHINDDLAKYKSFKPHK